MGEKERERERTRASFKESKWVERSTRGRTRGRRGKAKERKREGQTDRDGREVGYIQVRKRERRHDETKIENSFDVDVKEKQSLEWERRKNGRGERGVGQGTKAEFRNFQECLSIRAEFVQTESWRNG